MYQPNEVLGQTADLSRVALLRGRLECTVGLDLRFFGASHRLVEL
jgi:hypothetical protein